ncbi:hypothetical protein CTAYLR_008001 [Chrysophaeum taylorii]|uniref:Anaphase-promoting complex subunit 4 WD40 domain-containing protein n=1 Tax=Chrysophaeum taylorii TaxID=2483200 RepID=A0AAD7U8Q5_9STRA|nr:hypothetical protein CTAYLR_008001 [Chrysophaeum taylorii]
MRELFKVNAGDRGEEEEAIFSWDPKGNYLATAEGSIVHVWDRHGEHVHEVTPSTTAGVIALEWDKDGETLAIVQDGEGLVTLFDTHKRMVARLDTNLKDPSYAKWSRVGPQLVVGTAKGNVLVYNRQTRKKIPVLGKHPRRITCGAWSSDNRLALGSEDRTLTLSNESGDTIEQTELKHAATEMVFATQKTNDGGGSSDAGDPRESHLSINMGGQSLLLYDLNDPDNPLELAFQQRYGSIVTHKWFGDGFMMLGFSEGFFVVISTHISEIGEELFSGRFHQRALYDVAYSPTLKYTAVAGDMGIKLVEMTQFKELKREAIAPDALGSAGGQRGDRVGRVAWSPDGHILTAATEAGTIRAYLARMPIVHASIGPVVAYLSSLREMTVVNSSAPGARPIVFPIDLEPAYVAVGAAHVAVGMNNVVMFYRYLDEGPPGRKVNEQAYLGSVDKICLNRRFAAVLSGSKVTLHELEPSGANTNKIFPNRDESPDSKGNCASAVALTDHFLVFGTEAATVEFFSLDPDDWCLLAGAELRHATTVRHLYPNILGTRIVVVDALDEGFVYNPATAELTPMPEFPVSAAAETKQPVVVSWDTADKNVILVADGAELHTFVYAQTTIKGAIVSKLGPVDISADGEVSMIPKATPIAHGLFPICSREGTITCQISTGSLTTIQSPYYEHKDPNAPRELAFSQNLALLRLKDAWDAALNLNGRAYWLALSGKAMEVMEVDLAIRVYRQLGDAGMVVGLERIVHCEDKNLLAGHILLLFSNYGAAQDLFLSSSRPVTALEMRRDLLHWDQALKLAHTLDPDQEPYISVEYAQQLEFKGEYEPALNMFRSALESYSRDERKSDDDEAMRCTCVAGVSRCTLRLGDLRRGISYVKEAKNKSLCSDCAAILESMSQHSEAAALYEMADQFEKAAAIYVKKLNLPQAAAIMDKVTLPKLHSQYAKACEAANKFEDAVKAYEVANDMDSVVRLYLNQLNQPERAFDIVRRTFSSDGAVLVARFCQQHGDFHGAIEFMLMAKRSDEAFGLAKAQGKMEVYTDVLGDAIAPDDALNVAQFYETVHEFGKAGKFYAICGQYGRALKLFIQCGEKEINSAIEIVGKARSDALTHTLIDFLMGEPDGVPKDPNYIYRLYIALGNFQRRISLPPARLVVCAAFIFVVYFKMVALSCLPVFNRLGSKQSTTVFPRASASEPNYFFGKLRDLARAFSVLPEPQIGWPHTTTPKQALRKPLP